jgi:steroid delta-isomerase-like uncharacterized protein
MKKLLSGLSMLLLLCFSFGCQKKVAEEASGAVTRAEAIAIGQKYAEARNTVNLALLDEFYSPDVVVHDCSSPVAIQGLDALKAYYSNTHEALPDLKATIDETMVDGDKIILVWTFTGTHSGVFRTPLGEIPPTGKEVKFSGVAIDRLVEGKVVEEWVYFNVLDFLFQLGFSLAPPGPPDRL